MQTLSVQPEANDTRALMLTTFAASGDENGVRRVIAGDPGSVNELGLDGTSPLCAAAMWGHVTLDAFMRQRATRNDMKDTVAKVDVFSAVVFNPCNLPRCVKAIPQLEDSVITLESPGSGILNRISSWSIHID